jgi:hypothetical protein
VISAPWPWIFSNRSCFGSLSELIEWRLSPQSLRPEHLRAQQHPPEGIPQQCLAEFSARNRVPVPSDKIT